VHRKCGRTQLCTPNNKLPALPCADNAFAASLLNLVPDRLQAVREMSRVVRAGGMVSALFPLPALSRAARLADELALEGFSKAALHQWSRRAPTIDCEHAVDLFARACLRDVAAHTFLNGMVGAVTGRKPESME
jgi:hypothetical protein